MITFEQPLILLLLLPIGALVYLTWKRMSLPYPAFQRGLILVCRLLLFTLILLALAGTAFAQPVSRQATVFVGDISDSTGPQRPFIEQWIVNALKQKRAEDSVGIVAVGRNALVEQSVKTNIDFSRFESAPDKNYTDLAAGLRLAAAILPADTQRHIVLFTDGQQNLEDALPEAQLLKQQGIRLDVVPLPSVTGNEARIDGLEAPTVLHTNEHFQMHTKLYSSVAQKATLRIYLDSSLLSEQSISLAVGEQEINFDLAAPTSGFHTFRVTLEAPQDTLTQNNEASAFVNVQGPPLVLVVEGTEGSGQNIVSALKATGIGVEVLLPTAVPDTLDGLAKYSSVVLADVPALSLGNTRMQTLQAFVRDLGHGLVVSGGQNSYSLGSYAGTPLEQTLPVRMDIPQHKETPSIAVVLIVESLEEQTEINISKEAAKGVVNFLTPRDQVGVTAGYGTLSIPMQNVTDRAKINKAIDGMNPTDPGSYAPDLNNAEQVLLKSNAKVKHIILLGDGDAFDPTYTSIASRIANENITISTVATNSMSPQEFAIMHQIASSGKGRYYRADDPNGIPQILLQETQRAARRSIINENFTPAVVGNHPILTGIQGLPSLDGYVATTPKPSAQKVLVSHLDDPLLSVWQYGLGRVAAWTSDALGLWTKNWLSWDNAARWWANTVSWSLPSPSDSALNVSGTFLNGSGQLTVDLTSSIPPPGTQQQVQVNIVAPDQSQQTVTLSPTAPERWQGGFDAPKTGAYLLKVSWQALGNGPQGNSNKLYAESGLVVPYSPEYQNQGTDKRFLTLLSRAGGGTLLNPNNTASAFSQALMPSSASIPITFWLLMLAALLLPIDIAARRLANLDFLREGYHWLLGLFKPRQRVQLAGTGGVIEAAPTLASLNKIRDNREIRRAQSGAPSPVLPVTPAPSANTKQQESAKPPLSVSAGKAPTDTSSPTRTKEVATTATMASKLVEAKRKRTEGKR